MDWQVTYCLAKRLEALSFKKAADISFARVGPDSEKTVGI
jgi:hypothetical protein